MSDRFPSQPRFSVVIPTCRRNDSLARCLNQLMDGDQTLPAGDYEVIVSDDGPAADNARLMVRNIYPWARWVEGPRRGPAANRNRGAAEAKGEWLVFTDDDCLPQPEWLAAFAARLDGAAAADDAKVARVLEGRTTAGVPADFGPFMTVPHNETGGFLWSCNFLIERKLFEEIGGFDAHFPFPHLEDVDLRMRLEDRGETFPFVPEAVVEHPPRPVGSVRRWVESQESAFYLARKRGVPVGQIGPGFMAYLRVWVHTLRECRNAKEKILVTARLWAGVLRIACRWPFWRAKYRSRGGAKSQV